MECEIKITKIISCSKKIDMCHLKFANEFFSHGIEYIFFGILKYKILFHLYFYHFLAFKKFYRIPSCHCQYHWLRHYMKKAKWHIEIYNRGCQKVLILTKNGSKNKNLVFGQILRNEPGQELLNTTS